MAMKASPPSGTTWTVVAGLAAVFVGERILAAVPTARLVCDVAGLGLVLAMTLWRAVAFARERGPARRVEGLLLAGQVGCVVALALYFAGALVVAPGAAQPGTILTVAWLIILVASLVPLLLAQSTAVRGADEVVEEARVREAATSGLTIALALAFLFTVGYIASERDIKVDVSYFRTALPGSATEHMVEGLGEPLRVLLFFPEVNEVKSEVASYFDELAHATGRIEIEAHDRMAAPKLAKDHNVFKDGTVVLVKGKQSENIVLDVQLQNARTTLRTFDAEVQKALMKVARGARVAYVTAGHGEMTDAPPNGAPADPMTSGSLVREALGVLNYRVVELGVKSGLANDVPDDATLVLMLGPRKPFLPEELAALDRYLARGGSLFLALDATGETLLGPLEKRLGVHFDPTLLADDRQHLRQRNAPSDNRLLVTDQFSTHASVTTLARSRAGAGLVAPMSGALADVELADVPKERRPRRVYPVRTLPSTFVDTNGDFVLDGDEKRGQSNLVAAVEGTEPPGTDGKAPAHAMRAFIVAAAPMLSDLVLQNVVLNGALFGDGVKWLGGEEQFAGDTVSEKDIAIEHTRSEDLAWFYGTVVGAPLLVLGVGLGITTRRRRRRAKPGRVS